MEGSSPHLVSTFLFLCLPGCGSEVCTTHNDTFPYYYVIDCVTGCCGSYGEEYCCDTLVGSWLGGAVGIILMLVAVVVVICVVKKRRFNRVTLVSAHPTPIVNFIATPGTKASYHYTHPPTPVYQKTRGHPPTTTSLPSFAICSVR